MISPENISEKAQAWYSEIFNENGLSLQQSVFSLHKQLPSEEVSWLMQQAEGFRIASRKLPSWAKKGLHFPPKRALEQCSSEVTALFKAQLFSGKRCIDLTGGMGVDSWALAASFEQLVHVEQNPELSRITAYNFRKLGRENIEQVNLSAEEYLEKGVESDLIFIDPDRRPDAQKRVFQFEDCLPNIIELKEKMLEVSPKVLVKASPLIDLDYAIKTFPEISQVWVVAVRNECKEVLFLLGRIPSEVVKITAINFQLGEQQHFEATWPEPSDWSYLLSAPLRYLYEPNAALMKAGVFKSLAKTLSIPKLHPNSHLFTSEAMMVYFPGRKFEVEEVIPFQKAGIKALKKLGKANISVRNFPFSPEELRKKTGLKDGGAVYLFATTDFQQQKIILKCKKAE